MGNKADKFELPTEEVEAEPTGAGKVVLESAEPVAVETPVLNGGAIANPIAEEPEKQVQEEADVPVAEEKKEEVQTNGDSKENAIEELPVEKESDKEKEADKSTDSPSKCKKKRNPINWLKKNITFHKDKKPKDKKEEEAKPEAKPEEVKENGVEEESAKPAEEEKKTEEPAVNGSGDAPASTEEATPPAEASAGES